MFDAQEEIKVSDRAYFRARVRKRVHSLVLKTFREMKEREGLTKAELARRMNWNPSQISRLFGSSENHKISTLAELLMCMNHEVLLDAVHLADIESEEHTHPLLARRAAGRAIKHCDLAL